MTRYPTYFEQPFQRVLWPRNPKLSKRFRPSSERLDHSVGTRVNELNSVSSKVRRPPDATSGKLLRPGRRSHGRDLDESLKWIEGETKGVERVPTKQNRRIFFHAGK